MSHSNHLKLKVKFIGRCFVYNSHHWPCYQLPVLVTTKCTSPDLSSAEFGFKRWVRTSPYFCPVSLYHCPRHYGHDANCHTLGDAHFCFKTIQKTETSSFLEKSHALSAVLRHLTHPWHRRFISY